MSVNGAVSPGVRIGAQAGFGLVLANLAWQALLWSTGLNERPALLAVFYLLLVVAIVAATFLARRAGAGFAGVLGAGVVAAILGGIGVAAMMYVFLNLIGGGVLPPAIVASMETLRAEAAAGADVADRIASLEALTPTTFALLSGAQTAVIGVIAAAVFGAVAMVALRPRGLAG
ncbi:MAG: DUF4199 family protein [Alphaproteobacteria bacterium]|nr:DUF4199 family protein [Alphaproteobacteria bacterium]